MSVASRSTARHYLWGSSCDGWHLLEGEDLSVIEERVPPGAGERRHRHARARQFFYVRAGEAQLERAGETIRLRAGEGLHVAPGQAHALRNEGAEELRFLVVSAPRSHGDREDLP